MNFEDCLAFVLRPGIEGGYSNRKADRGGPTNRGVTQATYDEWRERKGYDKRSVRYIEAHETYQIYLEQYWKPTRCPALDHPMTLIMFDSAVNHGPRRAIKLLQQTLNVAVDGHFGPLTMSAFDDQEQAHGTKHIAAEYLRHREQFYADIIARDPTQLANKNGWANRLKALRQECLL